MKKLTILLLTAYGMTFSGATLAAENIKLAATQESKTAAPSMPEECVKLVAAIKACEKAGGIAVMSCKYAAESKFDCPIPLEKLM